MNITEFGAKSGDEYLNTQAIQQAIDACHHDGGGTVTVPAGRFITGTIILKSNVHLFLEHNAYLVGSRNKDDYPHQPKPAYQSLKDKGPICALIYADSANNIALTGYGEIDGQGDAFESKKSDIEGRPRLIQMVSCTNVRVQNLSLRNSGLWMQHYNNCEDLRVQDVTVYNHVNYNNDMIDIDSCRRVVVSGLNGDSDDDGICLKSTGPALSKDIVISNCAVHCNCNAIKIGTETTGSFENIAIANCTISKSRHDKRYYGHEGGTSGISIEMVDGGSIDGVTISNISMSDITVPLFVRLGNRGRKFKDDAPTPGIGSLKRVSISNILARNTGTIGSSISGLSGSPVEEIHLNNIQLFSRGGVDSVPETIEEKVGSYPEATMFGTLPACGIYLRHAKNVSLKNVTVGADAKDVRPPVVTDDVSGLDVQNLVVRENIVYGARVKDCTQAHR